MAERLSFTQQGTIGAAIDNPYTLYLELAGLIRPAGHDAGRRERNCSAREPQEHSRPRA